MPRSLQKPEKLPNNQLNDLENEIAFLEKKLAKAEVEINAFTAQIRTRLFNQIKRIHELSAIYRQQKNAKKAKRLEQKKKGKNYKEPQNLPKPLQQKPAANALTETSQQELKRLYKEAIRHVHPDKFVNEDEAKTEKATALTTQLNDLYETGNLDELKGFHEHILSGNAMSHIPYQSESISDLEAMLTYLRKKRDEIMKALAYLKDSELFNILHSYPEPLTFIDELKIQFDHKISQLEKRTRTKRK
jgi:hypothetical protein